MLSLSGLGWEWGCRNLYITVLLVVIPECGDSVSPWPQFHTPSRRRNTLHNTRLDNCDTCITCQNIYACSISKFVLPYLGIKSVFSEGTPVYSVRMSPELDCRLGELVREIEMVKWRLEAKQQAYIQVPFSNISILNIINIK